MIFRCKNCGGNVVYSPERKKMFCPFCESEDSEEREDGVIETSGEENGTAEGTVQACLLYTSPSPRDRSLSRMPSSA